MAPNQLLMNVDSAILFAPTYTGAYAVPASPDHKVFQVQFPTYQMITPSNIVHPMTDNEIMSSFALANGMSSDQKAFQDWLAVSTNNSLANPVMQQLQTPLESFMMDEDIFDSDVMLGSPTTEEKISSGLNSPVTSNFDENDNSEMLSGTFNNEILLDDALHSPLDFFDESGFSLTEAGGLSMVSPPPTTMSHSLQHRRKSIKQEEIETYIKIEQTDNDQHDHIRSHVSNSEYMENFFVNCEKKMMLTINYFLLYKAILHVMNQNIQRVKQLHLILALSLRHHLLLINKLLTSHQIRLPINPNLGRPQKNTQAPNHLEIWNALTAV